MFIGLHRHSHYSKRDAIAKVKDIVERVGELGQSAWALTDHGTTSGLMQGYKETMKYNKEHGTDIKFIFGIEAYWTPSLYIKDRSVTCHLLILAKNEVGYHNLLKLTTEAYGDKGKAPDNFFYTMRVTTAMLEKYKEGLIITSACMGGILNPRLENEMWDKKLAYERATTFKELFGEDFYLEIQCATDVRQVEYNQRIVQMGVDLDIPVFVSEDSHYVHQSEADIHRKWLGIELEPGNPKAYYQVNDYFIHSEDEVYNAIGYLSKDVQRAVVANTEAIANKCERVDIKFGGRNFPVLDLGTDTPLSAVCKKVAKGWKEKIEDVVPESEHQRYKDQIDHELHVLDKCGYLEYFLMTEDFLSWARSQGIRMGIGRGSVGGCLVAYLMDITRIDPIKYGLIFERFAHDKRVSLPDVDIDCPNTRRQDLIHYLEKKYGEVFHVRTFGTMGEKASIQRGARSLGYTADEIRNLSKTVNGIDDVTDPELKALATAYKGVIQNYGCHASAIMLFPSDATEWCAIEKQGEDYVCAYEYHDLEACGLLKEDVLGIKTLDAIDNCVRAIKATSGVDIDTDNLPDVDKATTDMLLSEDVKGCFQIESGGMVNIIKKIKPKSVFDIVPLVALYRPSTIQSGMVDEFIERRDGKQYEYLTPTLENALKETYGVMLYQEQAMKIVQDIAGYDLGRADMFRRAIGRKIPEEMATLIPEFVKDGEARGESETVMQELAEWLTNAAAYQFNKSHSAAYGLTCWQTAYLKAHYPAEYLCGYLNAYAGDAQEDLLPYIQDAKKHGIEILPPDARASHAGWGLVRRNGKIAIRMAINYIRGVGNIALPLTAETYKNLPKNKVEALIKAGALDFVGERSELLKDLYLSGQLEKEKKRQETAEERYKKNKAEYETAKEGTKRKAEAYQKMIKYREQYWDIETHIRNIQSTSEGDYDSKASEIEVLGMTFEDIFKGYDTSLYSEPDESDETTNKIVLGCVRRIKHWKQRNGKPMAFLTIECPSGQSFDIVMFNSVYIPLELNKVYAMRVQGNKFKRLV